MNFYTLLIIIVIIILYFIFNSDRVKILMLQTMIFLRGVLTPNCNCYSISEIILGDNQNGIQTYNYFKDKGIDFTKIDMFGYPIYVVTNIEYIKIILDNSPNIFSVGKIKDKFFKTFMEYNVGVSSGCPWKNRRILNEKVLDIDRLHKHSERYNNIINNLIRKYRNNNQYKYNHKDFVKIGRKIANSIIFNSNSIPSNFYDIFSEPNNLSLFYSKNFTIDTIVENRYLDIINFYIDNPVKGSLIYDLVNITDNKKEILHQVPHFIFPIVGLFVVVVPRLLTILCNNKECMKKVVDEINKLINTAIEINSREIYSLNYLRNCIMETLRLNNLVMTTFRTLTQDYKFNNKNYFKKGDQFLILNNPILRQEEFFYKPDTFIPDRWNTDKEQEYYALSYSQGPQRCPGKELSIFLIQSFIFNFITIYDLNRDKKLECIKIDTEKIPQVINPCKIEIEIIS